MTLIVILKNNLMLEVSFPISGCIGLLLIVSVFFSFRYESTFFLPKSFLFSFSIFFSIFQSIFVPMSMYSLHYSFRLYACYEYKYFSLISHHGSIRWEGLVKVAWWLPSFTYLKVIIVVKWCWLLNLFILYWNISL